MKALALNSDVLPQPDRMAVAVDSLTFGLLCLQPVDGYKAGDIRPVYAYNREEHSALSNGNVPIDWRMVVESGNYHKEVKFVDALPDLGEEVALNENPDQYQLILTDCRVIPMPVATEPETPTCRVIQHPATYAVRVEKPAHKRPANPKQLFLTFDEPINEPQNLTA